MGVRREVSATLGLAFWKAKVDKAKTAGAGAANDYCENMRKGRKRVKVGIF